MTLLEYIGYACMALFVIYWITLNFFSSNKTPPSSERPAIKPYSFFQKSGKVISKEEARKMISKQ